MRRLLTAGLAVLLVGPALRAGDDPPGKGETPRQRYEALFQEQQKAMQGFMQEYQKAKTQEERNTLFQSKYPDPAKFAGRFFAIAESAPDDPAAVDALIWVAQNASNSPEADKALDRLAARHADHKRIGELAPRLVYSQSAAAETLLRAAAEKSPSRETKGQATLALGQWLKQKAELAARIKADPKLARRMEAMVGPRGTGKELLARLTTADPDALLKEAEAAFERTARDFGDVKSFRDTLGKTAKTELYEIRNLGVGKPAPDITGADIDGKPFKLSDYKGKVVVVDFWGDW